jgi:hypothetical protein
MPALNILDNVQIASPCSADWEQMQGDERKRFCGSCTKNVYNLSGMTRRDAEALLIASEGKICVRLYRRADGTVLTADCPVGLAAAMKKMKRMTLGATAACLASAAAVFAFLGGTSPTCKKVAGVIEEAHTTVVTHIEPAPQPTAGAMMPMMGEPPVVPEVQELMGDIAAPEPTPPREIMGKIAPRPTLGRVKR